MTLPRKILKPKVRQSDRIRSQAHRDWVGEHACSVRGCEATYIEVAHVRSGLPAGAAKGGTSLRPGDDWCVSLCGSVPAIGYEGHHQESHRIGEPAFERKYGLDLVSLASEFAAKSPALKRYLSRKKVA